MVEFLRLVLRWCGRRHAEGGRVSRVNGNYGHMIMLSHGRAITEPDDADALGLTADARRMRREQVPEDERQRGSRRTARTRRSTSKHR